VLSLNSLGERRGLAMRFSDLRALLDGCSNLEVRRDRFHLTHQFENWSLQSSSRLIEDTVQTQSVAFSSELVY
jgi:hypothetical protein